MKEYIKTQMTQLLLIFCVGTTSTVFVCAVYNGLFWPGALLSTNMLWQMLLLCFMCSLGSFLHPCRETNRKGVIINAAIRYLYVNLVVLGGGHFFRWLDMENIVMLAATLFMILLIFLAVAVVMRKLYEKEAENLNRKLQEYQEAGENFMSMNR